MHKASKFVFLALVAMLLFTARPALAAPLAPGEKDKVLRRLDEAAKNFRSTSADFQFDSVETDPIYEKDVQKGGQVALVFRMNGHGNVAEHGPGTGCCYRQKLAGILTVFVKNRVANLP